MSLNKTTAEHGEHAWMKVARTLYSALLAHRADMHQKSSRPCATCRQSAEAIKAYDDLVNQATPSLRSGAMSQEMRDGMPATVTLTIEDASVLKAASQAWLAGCASSRHAGGHGPCNGHPALDRAVSAVRAEFERIVAARSEGAMSQEAR